MTRLRVDHDEMVALIVASRPGVPACFAFGPGWVALEVRDDGRDRWALETLARLRGVPIDAAGSDGEG